MPPVTFSPGRSPSRSSSRNGRLLSRRWRWVAGMAIVSFAFTIGLKLFDPEPYPAPNEDLTNPLLGNAVGEFIIDTGVWIPFAIGVLASLCAGALAVILRFRRSVGVERLQMKWLVGRVADPARPPARHRDEPLVRRRRCQDVRAPARGPVRARRGDRDRGRAVPAVCDRAPRQSDARLRDADAPAPRRLRGDHDRARRRRRRRLRVGRRAGDARRCACVPSPARTNPGSRRPPVPPGSLRGCSTGSRLRGRGSGRRPSTGGDRRRPRRRVAGSARGDLLLDPETGAYADATGDRLDELPHDERARREIRRDDTPTAVLLHDPTLLERRDLLDGVLAAAALSIEMARLRVEVRLQLAEVQALSVRASSRRATRSVGASSVTCTTVPSSASSRSGYRSGDSS